MANHCIPDDCVYIINMIKELLCVKRQQFELSSTYFNCHDTDCMINLCVLHSVIIFSFLLCVLTYSVTYSVNL